MIHTYVILCMLLNPTQCIRYEIARADDLSLASTPMACMMGGAIFITANQHTLTLGATDFVMKGGVRCEQEPPKVGEVHDWVQAEKARLERLEPQIK